MAPAAGVEGTQLAGHSWRSRKRVRTRPLSRPFYRKGKWEVRVNTIYHHVSIYLVLTWAPVGLTGRGSEEGNTHLSSNCNPCFSEGTSEIQKTTCSPFSCTVRALQSLQEFWRWGWASCFSLLPAGSWMDRFTNSRVLVLFCTTLPQGVKQLLSFFP